MTNFHDAIDPRLRGALEVTADAEQDAGASSEVTERLLAAVRTTRAAREHRRQLVWLTAAAAVVIAVTVVQLETARTPAPDSQQATASSQPADAVPPQTTLANTVAADFLPLRYASVPTNNGHIIQIVVPASALVSFGLEPANSQVDAVNADVFVGEDGLARAVRFSPLSTKEIVQ
jgi:hypothetical protein